MNIELLQKAQMMQRQSEEAERGLQVIDEQINELEKFNDNLDFLDKSEEKEILANLGKGVFIKSDIKDKKLFVEVGAGIIVRKSAIETRDVIEKQIKKFKEARIQILGQLEEFRGEFGRMVEEIEKLKGEVAEKR
jgi:prefoldin alpha subunit